MLSTAIRDQRAPRREPDALDPELAGLEQAGRSTFRFQARPRWSREIPYALHGGPKRTAELADGAQASAAAIHARSRELHAPLLAYANGDERLAGFEPLGATQSPPENHGRLVTMIPRIVAALEAGEIVLPADLQPPALTAQAACHLEASKSKAGRVATRQVEGETLRAERRETRAMIGRLKSFVKAFYGKDALTSFGFNLPFPPRRPRLEGDASDMAPATEPVATA